MNIGIDIFGFSEFGRKLWNIESYPHGELYYDLAYHAIVDGDIDLAMKYFSKTIEALEDGHALSVLDGQKPADGEYDPKKRARLKLVQ
jgi:hypothetical protein